jgi:hypothetical protein
MQYRKYNSFLKRFIKKLRWKKLFGFFLIPVYFAICSNTFSRMLWWGSITMSSYCLPKTTKQSDAIQHWLFLWRLKATGSKSTHVTSTNCSDREHSELLHLWNRQGEGRRVKRIYFNTKKSCEYVLIRKSLNKRYKVTRAAYLNLWISPYINTNWAKRILT